MEALEVDGCPIELDPLLVTAAKEADALETSALTARVADGALFDFEADGGTPIGPL
jgi:hypothetical protein